MIDVEQRTLCTFEQNAISRLPSGIQQLPKVAKHEAVLVAVEIPVGGREGRHFHSGTAVIHVTDGAITLDYEGKPTVRYKAGDSFFVDAKAVHEGINKDNVPAKAIATFINPKGQPVTTQAAAATK